jgi:HEPN domain-containing protein/predicted nucleotidyltransferase
MKTSDIHARVLEELPSLAESDAVQLAAMIERLVEEFTPDHIYLFGSHALGTPTADSDVDLFVVIPRAEQPLYQLEQQAHRAVGAHTIPLDIRVLDREEFDRRSQARASLPPPSCARADSCMRPEALQEASDWLTRARRDHLAAYRSLDAEPKLADIAVYHAQQAAENALKAYLAAHDEPFPKIHDLQPLVQRCEEFDPAFSKFISDAQVLTPYATQFSYPGGPVEPDLKEAQAAISIATGITDYVSSQLLPNTPLTS